MLSLAALPSAGQTIIPAPGTADRPRIDVESYQIDATIKPEESLLSAVVEVRFVQQDRQNFVLFDLDRRLKVHDVYLGEDEPLPVRFRQFDVDSTLEIDLSELAAFEQPVVRIEYEGPLRADATGPDGSLVGISPESAFLMEEGVWYPMNGVRTDPAQMRMNLSVPDGWQVVSPLPEVVPQFGEVAAPTGQTDPVGETVFRVGVEAVADAPPDAAEEPTEETADEPVIVPEPAVQTADQDSDNPVVAFFSEDNAAPGAGGVALATDVPGFWGSVIAGPFDTVAPPFVDGAVEVLVSDSTATAASEVGEAAAAMFDFFSDLFGPPASPMLRLIEVNAPDWDGQSASGILLLPPRAFRSDFDRWELAEQVAEQWFPLKFGVEDPVRDAWIGEGMGVFAALYYFDQTLDPADSYEYVRRTLVRALSYEGGVTLREAGTLSPGSAEYRSVAGYKGGFVFRMLREVMGEESFGKFLSEFSRRFDGVPVTTSAVMDLASEASGDDLTYFFSEWLDEANVPEFEREYRVLRLSAGGYKVEGQVTQDLDLFSMPVEIEVLTDGEPEYATVFLSGPSSDIDIFTERKPRSIIIDPNMKVLRMSPDIRVAVHISRGEDLADAGEWNAAISEYQAAVDLDRLSSLAFFRMGEALFELNALPSAADMFREALNGDLEPTWIEVWSYINIGKIYDLRIQRERALIEYQKAVNTADDAYGAQAEAQAHIERPFRSR